MEILNLERKRALVFGLVYECPLAYPLENCPAKQIRDLPLKDATKMVMDMEENQLDKIITCHRQCIGEREYMLFDRNG
jgi:hypothetical protein